MRFTFIPLAAIGALIACTPVISERGYLGDPQAEAAVKSGTDTKTSVQKRLGYPSITTTFGSEGWYYVSSTEKQVAFFTPTVQRRSILAIYFDKDGKVTGVRHYSLRDGHVFAFETRETPAAGRELTFLEQLLTATPSSPVGEQQNQPNPGGGGLP